MNDKNQDSKSKCGFSCDGIYWWATLTMAVLAVPAIGVIMTSLFQARGLGEVIIFILSCWVSVYIGMKIVMRPGMERKVSDLWKKK